MSFPFNASRGPIVVEASLSGPLGQGDLRLILDTGATTSLIRSTMLVAIGYDPDASTDRVTVAMGNVKALHAHRCITPFLFGRN